MSKKPSVELRRRNNKPHGTTPTDELKELLDSPLSVKMKHIENVRDELTNGALATEGTGQAASEANTGVDSQEPTAGYYYHHGYEDGKAAAQGKASFLSEKLEAATAAAPNYEEWVANEKYRAKNLILIVTRSAGSLSEEMNKTIRSTLELFPQVVEGAARGFKINLDSKAAYEPTASSLRMTFVERTGRVIGKLFETWGREIGRVGVGAHTTVDFMLIEPDPTGRLVLDAWNCRSMFPAAMTTSHGARDLGASPDYASLSTSWDGNIQLMEDVAAAQAVFETLQQVSSNPYQPS